MFAPLKVKKTDAAIEREKFRLRQLAEADRLDRRAEAYECDARNWRHRAAMLREHNK